VTAAFVCNAIVKEPEYHFCTEIATWHAEYSDREFFVCDAHREYVREARRGDHSYDQGGISWRSGAGEIEYDSWPEPREPGER